MVTMIRKLYGKLNKRTKQIEAVWVSHNDEQAQYEFTIANMQAEEQNRFYDSSNYGLICFGVLEMEGENIGIKYEYAKDYPFIFDEVKDFQIPKHNQPNMEDITVDGERAEKIKKEAKI